MTYTNSGKWMIVFADLAFVLLIFFMQSGSKLGESVYSNQIATAYPDSKRNEPKTNRGYLVINVVAVQKGSTVNTGQFYTLGGSSQLDNTDEKLTIDELAVKLAFIHKSGDATSKRTPYIVPQQNSLTQHTIDALNAVERVWGEAASLVYKGLEKSVGE